MKKKVLICLGVLSLVFVLGCNNGGQGDGRKIGGSTTPTVDDVIAQRMAEEDAKKLEADGSSETVSEVESSSEGADSSEVSSDTGVTVPGVPEDAPEPEEIGDVDLSTTEGIDIDLNILSPTMIYAEVYNMMVKPDDYKGKIIRMTGFYASAEDPVTGKIYYGCIIPDATACCTQGIEFEPAGDVKYPDDFPEEGGKVTVTGTFDTYVEDDYMYYTLKDAEMVVGGTEVGK